MTRGASILCAVLALSAAAQSPAPPSERQPLTAPALVAAVDEQIQLRFLDPMQGFGITRICGLAGHGPLGRPAQTLRQLPQPDDPTWRNPACSSRDWAPFEARNSQEEWVAGEVARAGVEIWALLIGEANRTLEGPVVLGTDSPEGMDDVRRELLTRAGGTPISDAPLPGWSVVVKPVRASDESCIGCHTGGGFENPPPITGLEVGDPLGYVVYLYR